MNHTLLCPNGHQIQVTSEYLGKEVFCPICHVLFRVPEQLGGGPTPPGRSPSPPASGAGSAPAGTQQAPQQSAPQQQPQQQASAPQAPAQTQPVEPIVAAPEIKTTPDIVQRMQRVRSGLGGQKTARELGLPMLLMGLVLVLCARGCDALGSRAITRATGYYEMAQNRFADRYEAQRLSIQRQLQDLEGSDDAARDRRQQLSEQLTELRDDEREERARLETGEWRELRLASRDARVNNMVSGYLYEVLFVLGTVVLAIGLIALGFSSDGPERLICLIMLAIITFSVYVGGIAWVRSLSGLAP